MMTKKLLMVLGPTEVESEILEIGAKPQEYMRTSEYSKKLARIFKNLQYVFRTKNPVVFFTSSGTGAMEAAVTNSLSAGDTVLYINGGAFGARWGEICRKHKNKAIEIKVDFGKIVNPSLIQKSLDKHKNIKAVFATLNETSSGALTDIKAIGAIIKNYPNTIFVVDCVSGLVVEEMQMDAWGIDVAVSSSQKALALPPGLSFMAISNKALSFAKCANLRTYYFDIFIYIENWKRNQHPFTTPVLLVNQLDARLQKIKKEGLLALRKRFEKNTTLLRRGLKQLGFEPVAENPANCVTGVFSGQYDAEKIIKIMRGKYNIEITPSGGDFKNKLFRIGNFGNILKKDIDLFLESLEKTLKELKNDCR
ncbi:serine-pyruvate aminotransferase [Endomicrobiia bacterium]|nr:serine-pyruvate aminotransferase [Endomicrobiia bacterium]